MIKKYTNARRFRGGNSHIWCQCCFCLDLHKFYLLCKKFNKPPDKVNKNHLKNKNWCLHIYKQEVNWSNLTQNFLDSNVKHGCMVKGQNARVGQTHGEGGVGHWEVGEFMSHTPPTTLLNSTNTKIEQNQKRSSKWLPGQDHWTFHKTIISLGCHITYVKIPKPCGELTQFDNIVYIRPIYN